MIPRELLIHQIIIPLSFRTLGSKEMALNLEKQLLFVCSSLLEQPWRERQEETKEEDEAD